MAARKTRRSVSRTTTRKVTPRRTTKRVASRGGNVWTREDVAFIRKYYRNNETSWVAKQLGRTVYSVRYKACDLSIKKSRPSVWRGNTGVTKATPKRNTPKKTTWKASSGRTTRTARPTKSRKVARRTPKKRR